jgi:glycerol-3-phosphate dehydrogenase
VTPSTQAIADTRAARVAGLTRDVPALAAPLGASCAVTQAAIVDAARHEMAVHLSDALLRRTEAGTAGHPGDDAVASAAAVMAGELAWTSAQTAAELEAVEREYRDMGARPAAST